MQRRRHGDAAHVEPVRDMRVVSMMASDTQVAVEFVEAHQRRRARLSRDQSEPSSTTVVALPATAAPRV